MLEGKQWPNNFWMFSKTVEFRMILNSSWILVGLFYVYNVRYMMLFLFNFPSENICWCRWYNNCSTIRIELAKLCSNWSLIWSGEISLRWNLLRMQSIEQKERSQSHCSSKLQIVMGTFCISLRPLWKNVYFWLYIFLSVVYWTLSLRALALWVMHWTNFRLPLP